MQMLNERVSLLIDTIDGRRVFKTFFMDTGSFQFEDYKYNYTDTFYDTDNFDLAQKGSVLRLRKNDVGEMLLLIFTPKNSLSLYKEEVERENLGRSFNEMLNTYTNKILEYSFTRQKCVSNPDVYLDVVNVPINFSVVTVKMDTKSTFELVYGLTQEKFKYPFPSKFMYFCKISHNQQLYKQYFEKMDVSTLAVKNTLNSPNVPKSPNEEEPKSPTVKNKEEPKSLFKPHETYIIVNELQGMSNLESELCAKIIDAIKNVNFFPEPKI